MISAGRTGLLSIICVALREARILLPPLAAPPVTGARLKFDILSIHRMLDHYLFERRRRVVWWFIKEVIVRFECLFFEE